MADEKEIVADEPKAAAGIMLPIVIGLVMLLIGLAAGILGQDIIFPEKEEVAESTDDYVSIAVDLASRITSLRSSRNSWRDVLINSPLGTASELMSSFESAFTLMAQDYSN